MWTGKGKVPDALVAHVQHEQEVLYGRKLTIDEARLLTEERVAGIHRGSDEEAIEGAGRPWRERYSARKALEAKRFRDAEVDSVSGMKMMKRHLGAKGKR